MLKSLPWIVLALTLLAPNAAFSAAAAGAPDSDAPTFQYPELAVTPRASERLDREAAREGGAAAWANLAPFYVSGAATLAAGLIQTGNGSIDRDPNGKSAYAGVTVGGAWLVGMAALAAAYHPYASGAADVDPMPRKSEREQLFRERLAEEDLDAPARLVTRLAWISALSNAAANVYMLTQAQGGSLAVPADIVGIAASLTPLIFQSYWIQVANDQHAYEKRIFAPVASASFVREGGTDKLAPEATVSFFF